METRLTPQEMMIAHIHLNMGVYFDDFEWCSGNLGIATSEVILDSFWNYAFKSDHTCFNEQDFESLSRIFRLKNREVTLWQTQDKQIPRQWSVTNEEVWMWLSRESFSNDNSFAPGNLNVRAIQHPTQEMQEVFHNAYSSTEEVGDVGYFNLPLEYCQAYARSQAHAPVKFSHIGGWIEDQCVVVATVGVWNGIGGIYSVATKHEQRRKGYGTLVSRAAARWAFDNGANGILLQTEANSPVEYMYQSLGFIPTHVGVLLSSNPSE